MLKRRPHPGNLDDKIIVKETFIGGRDPANKKDDGDTWHDTCSTIVFLYEPSGEPLIDRNIKSLSPRVTIYYAGNDECPNRYRVITEPLAKMNDSGDFIELKEGDAWKVGYYPQRKMFVERGDGRKQQLDVDINTPIVVTRQGSSSGGGKKNVEENRPEILRSAGNDYVIFIINRNACGFVNSVYLNKDNPAVRAIGVWKGEESPLRIKCSDFAQNCINAVRLKSDIINYSLSLSCLEGAKTDRVWKNPKLIDYYGDGESSVKNYLIDLFFEQLFYKDNTRKEYSDEVSRLVSEIEKLTSKTAYYQ